jgi:hypothetical protein
VDNLSATGDPDPFTTVVPRIESFVQKYREDPAFARRVDSSVLRILEAKMGFMAIFLFQSQQLTWGVWIRWVQHRKSHLMLPRQL